MYIMKTHDNSKAPDKFPDIHTLIEKILFRSRIFQSDLGSKLLGYTILTTYE